MVHEQILLLDEVLLSEVALVLEEHDLEQIGECLLAEAVGHLKLLPLLSCRLLSNEDVQGHLDLTQQKTQVLEHLLLPPIELSLLRFLELECLWEVVHHRDVVGRHLEDLVEEAHVHYFASLKRCEAAIKTQELVDLSQTWVGRRCLQQIESGYFA